MSVQIPFSTSPTRTIRFQYIFQVITQPNLLKKFIDGLNKLLELNSLELHVEEVRKRGRKIKIGDNEYKLSDFDTQKNEILEELKKAKKMIIKI